jgi:hypothetical protein
MASPDGERNQNHDANDQSTEHGQQLSAELSAMHKQQAAAGRNDEELTALEPAAFAAWQARETANFPRNIEVRDFEPKAIGPDETLIVLQRHPKYFRRTDGEDQVPGALVDPVGSREADAKFFEEFLAQIPPNERDKVDVLFLGSDTQYHGQGRRSFETAQVAQEAVASVLEAHGMSPDNIYSHILNYSGDDAAAGQPAQHLVDPADRSGFNPKAGAPEPMAHLSEPNVFNDSPEFIEWLKQQTDGEIGLQFFIAYEEDQFKERRQAMGAEGPDEIADRTAYAIHLMADFAKQYHADHTDRRLLIWAGTHYDTISPLVKRDVLGAPKEQPLGVDYGAGITIKVDRQGRGSTSVSKKDYVMPLAAEPPTYRRPAAEQDQ